MTAEEKPLFDSSKMEYRYLGNTGLRVSVLGFGVMFHDNIDTMKDLLKICLKNGINFFDTAEAYGFGKAEKTFGQAIKDLKIPREKIIVTIKIYMSGSDPNDIGEGRKHIIEGTKNSLKKLQLDYCDVVYAHRYDMNTPIEETVRAMNYLIEKGLAFYWATSEWTADQIERAFNICKERNLIPPICDQAHYNLLYRENIDSNYRDLFKYRKYGITSFSPLEYGILTGKYFDDKSKDSERSKMGFMREWDKNKKRLGTKIKKIATICQRKIKLHFSSIKYCLGYTK